MASFIQRQSFTQQFALNVTAPKSVVAAPQPILRQLTLLLTFLLTFLLTLLLEVVFGFHLHEVVGWDLACVPFAYVPI